MRRRVIVIVLLASGCAMFGAAALTAGSGPADSDLEPQTLLVDGSALVRASPDRAYVDFAVRETAPTPAESQSLAAKSMGRVIRSLESLSLGGAKIITTSVTLEPVFKRDEEHYYIDETKIVAYTAQTTIRFSTHDVNSLGAAVDAAGGAGVDSINRIWFMLADDVVQKREAMRAATADARAQAEAIAEGLGLRIVSIRRASAARADVRRWASDMTPFQSTAHREPTRVFPEQVSVEASVQVLYSVVPRDR